MSDQPESTSDKNNSPNLPPVVHNVSGGIDLHPGDDVNITGDVAGRDITKVTTYVGMQPDAVRRLVIAVAAMVFATAACFFTGGIFVGSKVLAAFDRNVNSSPVAAASMQVKLDAVQNAQAGQTVALNFGEDELSSYVRYKVGDQLGFVHDTGRARLVEPGLIAVSGQLASVGNLPVVVALRLTKDPNQPLQVESAAIRPLTIPGSNFGWVAVPTGLVSSLTTQANNLLAPGFTPVSVRTAPGSDDWSVIIRKQ
jgi:hypothetical protein